MDETEKVRKKTESTSFIYFSAYSGWQNGIFVAINQLLRIYIS